MTPDRLLLTLLVLASVVSLCWLGRINATVQKINQVVREAQ
jgi:hypothetical protein